MHSPVALAHCHDVTFLGNGGRHPASCQSTLVAVGDNVIGVLHGDHSGIRVTVALSASALSDRWRPPSMIRSLRERTETQSDEITRGSL